MVCVYGQVHVCNDADAAILAEQWVGTAKANVTNFIMLSMKEKKHCDLYALWRVSV